LALAATQHTTSQAKGIYFMTITAPPCAQSMAPTELRTWHITALVVLIIVVGVNWWHRAAPALPPFTNL